MSNLKNRVERMEAEYRFRRWFHFERYLESLRDEQLLSYARKGFIEGGEPEPLPPGSSRLDSLGRKRLIELWQDDERRHASFTARSPGDQDFWWIHGHWPERPCDTECVMEQ